MIAAGLVGWRIELPTFFAVELGVDVDHGRIIIYLLTRVLKLGVGLGLNLW